MSNDRNAGRKPKYGSVELKVLQRKIPKSKFKEIADKVDEILIPYQLVTPEQLKSIANTSSPAKEIAEMVKGKTEGI